MEFVFQSLAGFRISNGVIMVQFDHSFLSSLFVRDRNKRYMAWSSVTAHKISRALFPTKKHMFCYGVIGRFPFTKKTRKFRW